MSFERYPEVFSVDWIPSDDVITPGDSLEIEVSFSPLEAIEYTDDLTIYNSDEPVVVSVQGTGEASEPEIALSTDSLIFPITNIGSTSELPLIIYNSGSADLLIDSMNFNQYPEIFSVNWNPGNNIIAPGDSLEISVRFSPLATIEYSDNLNIYNNDELAVIVVQGPESEIALSQNFLLFPSTKIGNTAVLPLTILNVGGADLSIDSMIIDQYPDIFSVTLIPVFVVIPPGDSLEIAVNFTPLETIEYNDNLYIYNNDELVEAALYGDAVPFDWIEHTIAGFGGAYSVYAIDIDGDSDVDVLGAGGDDIMWFENDGNQNFITHSITYGYYDDARDVFAVDLDNDGDIDILGASHNEFLVDAIAWWENNGNQNFSQQHTIDQDFDGAQSVYSIDLDSDGDMDVLGAAEYGDEITWWENDGNQNFIERTITDNFNGAYSVYAVDLDGDNDLDVLGAASLADAIKWWENDGNQNFTEHTISGGFDAARSVFAIDLDGDNDIDVLGAARLDNDIYWWENDGNQNFIGHSIAGGFYGACDVYATDFDSDGDIDVLGGGANGVDDIAWWENDGNQNFIERTITENFNGAYSVYSIDLDNDGDKDVLGAAYFTGAIAWWESDLAIASGSEIEDLTISISGEDVLLEWPEMPQAVGYHVYRSTDPYFDITGMTPIANQITNSYLDQDVVSGTLFYIVTVEY